MEPRFVQIAAALARRRAVRAAGAAALALGVASGALPLLDAPGYELGELLALAAVALAPPLALAAVRLERTRPLPSPASAWAGAAAVLLAILAIAAAGALLRAALGPCAAITGATAFVPLLAAPSALLAAAVAVVAAFTARGRTLRALLLYAAAVLLSLAWTLRRGWAGPAAFLFDPFLGAWPGPLYDEALQVDARVVLLRAEAAALAVAVVALGEALLRVGRTGRVRLRGALPAVAVLAVAAGAAVSLRVGLGALALSGDRDALARALGGRLEGTRCALVFPAEKPAAAAAALLGECEFHAADVARALAIETPPRVTAYVYRSAAEKRRLVGAGATEYAKPWLAEVHVVDAPLPHPVLRHELVHAVAGALAPAPLHVPARLRVLPSAGLVEGLAVALDVPRSAWTVHEWSRAARDQGLLPDVARIVGPAGFWTQAPARAYTAAGSFLAFLLDRHGARPIARAYATADLAGALGAPLPALVAEWQRFLDGVEVPAGLGAVAHERLARGSLFARRCAREIATLEADAAAAAATGRTDEATALWAAVAARTSGPSPCLAAADARALAGDLAGAAAALDAARARAPEGGGALSAALASARGDLAWRRGDAAAAAAAWGEALATHPDRGDVRLLEAKRAAATDPELSTAARAWLLGDGDGNLALARVARSQHALAAYLVGRALLGRGDAAAAAPELARAAAAPLPPALAEEARVLAGGARCLSGDVAAGTAALEGLARGARSAAERERLELELRRCAFEEARRRAEPDPGRGPATRASP